MERFALSDVFPAFPAPQELWQSMALDVLKKARAWLFQAVRSNLTKNERRFLLSCKVGELDWSLAGLRPCAAISGGTLEAL